MALGVFEAVKNAGKQKQVAVVGTDGIREAKRSIGAGEMRATVAEFPSSPLAPRCRSWHVVCPMTDTGNRNDMV